MLTIELVLFTFSGAILKFPGWAGPFVKLSPVGLISISSHNPSNTKVRHKSVPRLATLSCLPFVDTESALVSTAKNFNFGLVVLTCFSGEAPSKTFLNILIFPLACLILVLLEKLILLRGEIPMIRSSVLHLSLSVVEIFLGESGAGGAGFLRVVLHLQTWY